MVDYSLEATVQMVKDSIVPSLQTTNIIIIVLFVAYVSVFIAKYIVCAYEYFYDISFFKGFNVFPIFPFIYIQLALLNSWAISLNSASLNASQNTLKFTILGTLGFDILVDLVLLIYSLKIEQDYLIRAFLLGTLPFLIVKLCACGILFNIFWSLGLLLLPVLYCVVRVN